MLADLIVASGVLLLGVLASHQTRGLMRLRQALVRESAERTALAQEMQGLLECSRTLGVRVREQNARHLALSAQLQTIARHAGPAAAYGDAQRLLNEGLEVDKVASICELSQGEAALLSRWRARRAAA